MQPIQWKTHWDVVRRHKLFIAMTLMLGPIIGHVLNGERGLMFGCVVSVIAVIWLWGAGRPE